MSAANLLLFYNILEYICHSILLTHFAFGTNDPINTFQLSVAFHIATSHLICYANQMTGFYMKCNTRLKWVDFKAFQYFTIITVEEYWDALEV